MHPCRLNRVVQKHRDRHGANTTRHRSDRGCLLRYFMEIDITDEPEAPGRRRIADAVHTHVHHYDAFPDHVSRDRVGTARRCDKNIGLLREEGKISGSRVAHRNRGITQGALLRKEIGKRTTDDVAAPHDDDMTPRGLVT